MQMPKRRTSQITLFSYCLYRVKEIYNTSVRICVNVHLWLIYWIVAFYVDRSLFSIYYSARKENIVYGDDVLYFIRILKVIKFFFFLCGKTIQGYVLIELKRYLQWKTYQQFYYQCYWAGINSSFAFCYWIYQCLVQWEIRLRLLYQAIPIWWHQLTFFLIKIYLLIYTYWVINFVGVYFSLKHFRETRRLYIKRQNFWQKIKYGSQDLMFFLKANIFFVYSAAVIRLRDLQLPYNMELGYPMSWSKVGTICEAMYQNNGFFYWTINTTLQQQLRQKIKTYYQPPLYLDNSAPILESNVLALARQNWKSDLDNPIFSADLYSEIYEHFLDHYKLVLLEELKCDPLAIVHHNLGTFSNLKIPTIYNEYLTNNGIIDRIFSRWHVDPENNLLTLKVSETSETLFLPNETTDEMLFRVLTLRGYWKPDFWIHPKVYSYWYELICEIYATFFPYHFYWAKCVSNLGMGGGVLPTFAIFGTSFYYNPEFILTGFYFAYYLWWVRRCMSDLTGVTDKITPEGIVITTSVYQRWWNDFRFDICIPYLRFDPCGKDEEIFVFFLLPFVLIPYYVDYYNNRPWKRGVFVDADYTRYLVRVMRHRIYGDKEHDPYLNPWLDELSPLTILMDRWHARSYRQTPYLRNLHKPLWSVYDIRVNPLFVEDELLTLDYFEKIFQQQNAGNTEDFFSDETADAVISLRENFIEYKAFIFQGFSRVRRETGLPVRLVPIRFARRHHVCDLEYTETSKGSCVLLELSAKFRRIQKKKFGRVKKT